MSFASSSACFRTAGTVTCSAAGRVEVELEAPAGCRGCEGFCAWRRLPATRRATFCSQPAFAEGDRVVVSLRGSALLTCALIAYGVPLVTLLGGALAGWTITATDVGGIGGAVAALAAVPWFAGGVRRRAEQHLLQQLTLTPGPR